MNLLYCLGDVQMLFSRYKMPYLSLVLVNFVV